MKRCSLILVLLLLVILPCSLMAAKKNERLLDKNSQSKTTVKSDRKETVEVKSNSTVTNTTTPVKDAKGTTSAINDVTPVEIIDNTINSPAAKAPQSGETIGWQVFSGGATKAISTSYSLEGTLGQVAVGLAVSTSYSLNQGYWQDFGGWVATCCGQFASGFTGNTTCDIEGKRNLADITSLIDHVYISKDDLCCNENGNTTGDAEGKRNLADITSLIDHVYIGKEQTAACL